MLYRILPDDPDVNLLHSQIMKALGGVVVTP